MIVLQRVWVNSDGFFFNVGCDTFSVQISSANEKPSLKKLKIFLVSKMIITCVDFPVDNCVLGKQFDK